MPRQANPLGESDASDIAEAGTDDKRPQCVTPNRKGDKSTHVGDLNDGGDSMCVVAKANGETPSCNTPLSKGGMPRHTAPRTDDGIPRRAPPKVERDGPTQVRFLKNNKRLD